MSKMIQAASNSLNNLSISKVMWGDDGDGPATHW